jgi:steroid delta-isomerase-like uncharacterized protein
MTEQARRGSDGNKAVMERFYAEVATAGNIDLIDELLADDFVEHEEFPGMTPDRDGVRRFFGMFKEAFPDGTFTPEQLIAEDDLVAARVWIRGTHQGEFMGIPATGIHVELQAIDIVEFRDGLATAHWGVSDMMAMMQQLGAIPGPPG